MEQLSRALSGSECTVCCPLKLGLCYQYQDVEVLKEVYI